MKIMVLNLGSTSFKYKLFEMDQGEKELSSGLKTIGVVILQCLVAWAAAFVVFTVGGILF